MMPERKRKSVKKKSRNKLLSSAGLLLSLILLLGGCGTLKEDTLVQQTYLYYRSQEENKTEVRKIDLDEMTAEEAVSYCLNAFEKAENGGPLLPDGISLLNYRLENGILTLNFSASYDTMDKVTELLTRACYVRTLTQIDGISEVAFTVDGKALKDSQGNEVGLMSASTFIENAAKSVNNYQYHEITLYFTDANGHVLLPEGRAIYYSSNKSLEWAVVERLIAGPKVSGHAATLSADTQIISVTSQDGTCYVNLDQSFATTLLAVDAQVTIYSIVNSLIQNCDVKRVQIAVNGSNNVVYDNEIDLSQSFELNTDLIQESTAA